MQIREKKVNLSNDEIEYFFNKFSETLLYKRGTAEVLRLLQLTNTEKLPEYERTRNFIYFDNEKVFAPTDEKGNPIFFNLKKNYNECKNDGERWLFIVYQASQYGNKSKAEYYFRTASFLYNIYGLITLHNVNKNIIKQYLKEFNKLKDNETIAVTGTGIRKIILPENYNFIKLFKKAAIAGKSDASKKSFKILSEIYMNRYQYSKALKILKQYEEKFGKDSETENIIQQISDNYGTFLPILPKAAGTHISLTFKYRNADSVIITIYKLKLKNFIHRITEMDGAELKNASPNTFILRKFEEEHLKLDNESENLFIKETEFNVKLTPPSDHTEAEIEIPIPVQSQGCYLAVAKLKSNSLNRKYNIAKTIFKLVNAVINIKKINNSCIMFVTDSKNGAPLPNIKVELFNFRKAKKQNGLLSGYKIKNIIQEKIYKLITNKNGTLQIPENLLNEMRKGISFIILKNKTKFAFLDGKKIEQILSTPINLSEKEKYKAYIITDKTVYRPGETVHFTVIPGQCTTNRNSLPKASPNKQFSLQLISAKNQIIMNKSYMTDASSSFNGSFTIPPHLQEGEYSFFINTFKSYGGFSIEKERELNEELIIRSTDKEQSENALNFEISINKAIHKTQTGTNFLIYRVYRSLFPAKSADLQDTNTDILFDSSAEIYNGAPKLTAKNILLFNGEKLNISILISSEIKAFPNSKIQYDIIAELNRKSNKKIYAHKRITITPVSSYQKKIKSVQIRNNVTSQKKDEDLSVIFTTPAKTAEYLYLFQHKLSDSTISHSDSSINILKLQNGKTELTLDDNYNSSGIIFENYSISDAKLYKCVHTSRLDHLIYPDIRLNTEINSHTPEINVNLNVQLIKPTINSCENLKVLCIATTEEAFRKNTDKFNTFFKNNSFPYLGEFISSLTDPNINSVISPATSKFYELSIFSKYQKDLPQNFFLYSNRQISNLHKKRSINNLFPHYPSIVYFRHPFNSSIFRKIKNLDKNGKTSFQIILPSISEPWNIRCYLYGVQNKKLITAEKNIIIEPNIQ
jgi:hypothetical protein